MATTRKSSRLRIISGSKKQPVALIADLPFVTHAPPAPQWLAVDAAHEWDRICALLVTARLLNEGSLSLLAIFCSMTASVTRTLAAGMPAQAATITALRLMACDFGLTPMSQQRLKPVPPPPAQNTFDDLKDGDAP